MFRTTRNRGRSVQTGWSHWFPYLVFLLILLLAPVLAYGQTAETVVVRWTAPGDDGASGIAAAYDLRYSVAPITASNFDQAQAVTGLPVPVAPGSRQTVTLSGLVRGTPYYFAIKTRDDAGNWAPISNLPRYDWILDAAPPAAPSGLAAARDGGSVRVQWSANSEADLAGYKVYRANSAEGPFDAVSVNIVTTNEYVDTNIPAGAATLWYRVSAVDATDNESAQSASVSIALDSPSASTQVKVEEGYPNPSRMNGPVRIPMVIPPGGVVDAYVEIVDSGSRRVRTIRLGNLTAGRQELTWDGKNDAAQACAPGVYRGWVVTNKDRQSIRIVRVP